MVQERLTGFGTANIKVFGIGGGGGNAINECIGILFLVFNLLLSIQITKLLKTL